MPLPNVIIQEIKLIDLNQNINLDIEPITLEFSLFEDIGAKYLECELIISDALGILTDLNRLPLYIKIKFKTQDDDLDFRTHVFAITSIRDRQRIEDKIETYNLRGVSPERLALTKTISRGYGPKTIKGMIESVYAEHLKDIGNKKLFADETEGVRKLVIPNLEIERTLDFLCNETEDSMYVFFENSQGFMFKNLRELIRQTPVETYSYKPFNIGEIDSYSIIDYNVVRQGDVLNRIREVRVEKVDVLRKYFNVENFNSGVQDAANSRSVFTTTSRHGHDTLPIFQGEHPLPHSMDTTPARRLTLKNSVFDTILDATLPGSSNLTAGQVISLVFPVATDTTDKGNTKDKYLSGNYLITNARHKMGGEHYNTFIRGVRI